MKSVQRTSLALTAVLFGILLAGRPAYAISTEGYSLFGTAAPTFLSSSSGNHNGVKLGGGIQFPAEPTERQSIRVSTARIFDSGPWNRYNFLLHAAYRFIQDFEAGVLIGVEYLDSAHSSGTYLKPLIGLETLYTVKNFGANSLSIVATYEVAQGSTGSIALDGGPTDLSANFFSIGLLFSFSVLR